MDTFTKLTNADARGKSPAAGGTGVLCRIEWPTAAVAACANGGLMALTWLHDSLPLWILAPAGAALIAWFGSLQHEVVHGHPTGRRAIDRLFVLIPFDLWLPFERYRMTHLAHHRSPHLTHPIEDTESFFMTPAQWREAGPLRRAFARILFTAAGRLLLGPAVMVSQTWRDDAARMIGGDAKLAGIWGFHIVGAALVAIWVTGVCGLSPWVYLGLIVYPGLSLTLLRSFAEHRVANSQDGRTAIVDSGHLFSLLYLNNNLHSVHHRWPGLAWYRLPARLRERRAELVERNGGYVLPGYRAILSRWLFRPIAHPAHAESP